MKMQTEVIRSYDTIKDGFHKVWHGNSIFNTDIDPHDILDEVFDCERFIDKRITSSQHY